MAGQHPYRDQIGEGHGDADDQSHGGDAWGAEQHAGDGQCDVGVETVATLEQRGETQRRQIGQPSTQAGQQKGKKMDMSAGFMGISPLRRNR